VFGADFFLFFFYWRIGTSKRINSVGNTAQINESLLEVYGTKKKKENNEIIKKKQ